MLVTSKNQVLTMDIISSSKVQGSTTDNRLEGRIAIVTGGSSGIGRAIAIRFADSGARIAIADLKSAGVEKEITDKHGKDSAIFVKCDVTKESDIENMVKETAKWGGRVDISLNFAGAY